MKLYTLENCTTVALTCSTTSEFRTNYRQHYKAAIRNKWLTQITQHFVKPKPKEYWTKEICKLEAAKFKNRAAFKKYSNTAYRVAKENNWLEEFIPLTYNTKYCGYSIVNKTTNQVYVGITRNFEQRIKNHKGDRNSTTSREIVNLPETVITQLTDYVILPIECKDFETTLYEMYKEKGFTLLNKVNNLGNLGNTYSNKLTKETVIEALKQIPDFKSLSSFNQKLLRVVRKNGWENCAPHITFPKPNNYWTKERCIEAAKNYTTRKEFKNKEKTAYRTMCRYGWLSDLDSLMVSFKPNGYWEVKEHCLKEAKKYQTRSEFAKKAVGAYTACRKFKWLEEACNHMKNKRKVK